MKNSIFITVCILAFNSLSAQEIAMATVRSESPSEHFASTEEHADKHELSKANENYLRDLILRQLPENVKSIEIEAAQYDLKNSEVYDNSEVAIYTVIFKRKSDELIASYNSEGRILTTVEKYRNVKLPADISIKISNDNPGWIFKSNGLHIKYVYGKGVQKTYKIKLKKGKKTRIINIDN